MLESEAYFTGRLAALKLTDFAPKFAAKDWTTVNAFAFSNSYVPGRADESVLAEKVFKPILGGLDHAKEHAVRRLFFESHLMATSEVQRRMSNPEEEGKAPRKLPIEERGQRWKDIVAELPLLDLRGELEPSYALTDKYVAMEEQNELRYLHWEEFTKRDQEQTGVKKIALWAEVNGQLQRYYEDVELVHHPEDRLELKYALQRRGLAMQLGRLVSFACHEKLVNYYFEELARSPVDPRRFEKVSVPQILSADKELFIRIAEETRSGFKALGNIPAKVYPLDDIMKAAMKHPRVIQLLLPHPIATGAGRPQEQRNDKKRDNTDSQQINYLKNEIKKLKSSNSSNPQPTWTESKGKGKGGSKSKGKGGNKGKGKQARSHGPPMPKELRGMRSEIDGKKLCYAYNMKSGCTVSGKDRCERGFHMCCYPECYSPEDHSMQRCPEYAKRVLKDIGR